MNEHIQGEQSTNERFWAPYRVKKYVGRALLAISGVLYGAATFADLSTTDKRLVVPTALGLGGLLLERSSHNDDPARVITLEDDEIEVVDNL